MPKKLVIANWKMNPETLADARALVLASRAAAKGVKAVSLVVCPPLLYLADLVKEFGKGPKASRMVFGAQNSHSEKSGAYTGEVSPTMLRTAGVEYVILGHSERRAQGETDLAIQKKVAAALKAGLSVVLCMGESRRDDQGEYLHVIEGQVKDTIPQLPRKQLDKITIAYEPLWAIGANAPGAATPEEVFGTTIFIRKMLTEVVGKDLAMKMPILYGGSVDAENAGPMLAKGGVHGLLVGRQSLNPKDFANLLSAVGAIK